MTELKSYTDIDTADMSEEELEDYYGGEDTWMEPLQTARRHRDGF